MLSPFLRELTDEVQEEAFQELVALMNRLLGDASRDLPETWIEIAKERGCEVYDFHRPGGGRGEYGPTNNEGIGIIAFNTAYSADVQVRVICHELIHHELHVWLPPQLPSAEDMHCYEGDVSDVRHRIARRVEEAVFSERRIIPSDF